jgi:hypothetical protein
MFRKASSMALFPIRAAIMYVFLSTPLRHALHVAVSTWAAHTPPGDIARRISRLSPIFQPHNPTSPGELMPETPLFSCFDNHSAHPDGKSMTTVSFLSLLTRRHPVLFG